MKLNRGIRWPQEHIWLPESGSLSTIPEDAVEVVVVLVAGVVAVVVAAVRAVTSVK